MSGSYIVPSSEALASNLTMVLGEEPTIRESSLLPENADFIAIYLNEQSDPVAACYCDWPIACGLGSALSLVPPAIAEEMVREHELSEIAEANLYEVMNIFSSMFMNDETPHLRLTSVEGTGGNTTNIANAQVSASFEVDAGRYPGGHITFVCS